MLLKKSYQNNSHLLNTADLVASIKRKWLEFLEFIHENKHHGVVGITAAFYKEYTLGVLVGGLSMVFVALSLVVLSVGPAKQSIFVMEAGDDISFAQLKQVNARYNLETTAHAVIYDQNWKKQNIVDFSSNWSNLSRQEKQEIKQTVWFQLLENALIQKLQSNQVKVKNGKRNKLLVALSEKLNIKVPADSDATVYKTGLNTASVGGDRNKVEQKKTVVKAKTVALSATDIKPLIKEEEDTAERVAQPEVAQIVPQPAQLQSQPALEPDIEGAQLPQGQSEKQDLQVAELDNVVQSLDHDPYAPDMMAAAKPLNTVELSSTKKGRIIRFDDAQLAAQKNAQEKQEPQVVASARDIALVEPESGSSALDKITTLFASSYETGNIKVFASLFSSDAVSNDAPDLEAITAEYAGLFASTTDRLMKIDNMKWNLVNDTATGDGQLQVSVRANDSDQKQTYSGVIHFEAKKQGNDWRITKLYHAIN